MKRTGMAPPPGVGLSPNRTAPQAVGGEPPAAAAALALLQPLRPVLAGFAHRNKNQHRGAKWWGAFAMLQRHAGKLCAELARGGGAGGAGERKTKTKTKTTTTKREREEMAKAARRARWVRDALMRRCYLAFSQLAADNQFATLGIVLLGVLAQVRSACVHLVGEGEEDGDEEEGKAPGIGRSNAGEDGGNASVASASTTKRYTEKQGDWTRKEADGGGDGGREAQQKEAWTSDMAAKRKHGGGANLVDLGTVVSREDVAAARNRESSERPHREDHNDLPSNQWKKQKLDATPAGPTVESVDQSLTPVLRGSTASDGKSSKKKKRKSKKGDEFDDLFSSLV